MLYRSTDRLCRCGAPVQYLSNSASFHSLEKYAPPNAGTKHLLHTTADYGLPRVRTELQGLFVIPSLAPHPIQADCEFAGHRHLGDPTFAAHREMQELASPIGIGTDSGFRRFYQEKK